MYRWFIALKYLSSRFITFAALLTVASAVALLIVILSVMEGFKQDLQDRIRGTSADLRVQAKGLIGLRDTKALEARVAAIPGVRAAVPYVETLAMLGDDDQPESNYFFIQALDLTREAEAGSLNLYLEAARERGLKEDRGGVLSRLRPAFTTQPTRIEQLLSNDWLQKGLWDAVGLPAPAARVVPAFVGIEAAERLQLYLGRTLRLTSYSPVANEAVSGEFVVAGIFFSRDYLYDSRTILMGLGDGIEFLKLNDPQTGGPSLSGLRILLENETDLSAMAARVEEAAKGEPFVSVRTWREEKASLLLAVRIEKTVVGIILGVLIVFAGFMIFIVLTVQVVEKTRDLGILQSLGSTAWGIASIYFRIGSGVFLIGGLLGAVLGVGFSLSINSIQRWIYLLVGFELFPRDVYYIDEIPVRLDPADLLWVFVPTALAALFGSVIPALRAARKDPVVALRYE